MRILLSKEEVVAILLDAVKNKYFSAFREGLHYRDTIELDWEGVLTSLGDDGRFAFFINKVEKYETPE